LKNGQNGMQICKSFPHQSSTEVIAGFTEYMKKPIYGFVQTWAYESL
jgi:hypothetical protein